VEAGTGPGEGGVVYEVMMRCPNSLQQVPLGMEIEELDNWAAITFVKFLYLCGSCGDTHVVNKQYARPQAKGTVLAFKRTPAHARHTITDTADARAEVTRLTRGQDQRGNRTPGHSG
jgi:hypothetical protein